MLPADAATDRRSARTALTQPTDEPLVAALVDELTRSWRQGTPLFVESLFARHPELWDPPERALGLVYEEICIRQELGYEVRDEELSERFPRWRQQLELMRVCHDLLEPGPERVALQAGDMIAGYRLLAPLGSGTSGRVFLAAQPALGDRPVVVKITARHGSEHCQLARLQHTHIMPLFAAHDDPVRELRILCMPYFGGTSLDKVLAAVRDRPLSLRSGADLLRPNCLDQTQRIAAAEPLLTTLTYTQGVCWLGACLAEALHYAHLAGILHLDLKPANILLTAHGQPMLLDFHLARRPSAAGAEAVDGLGGTPGYMAPEQAAGLQAVQQGAVLPQAIDQRADVFALGAVLYEALGGSLPLGPGPLPPLTQVNPQVSVGLSDLIARCLAADPAQRLADAQALADDLHRHLADQPLQHVPNRSCRERLAKWRRRYPAAFRGASLWSALLAVSAVVVLWTAISWQRVRTDARQVLDEVRTAPSNRLDVAAPRRLRAAWDNVQHWPAMGALADELTAEIARADQAELESRRQQQVRELHGLAERVRALYGVNGSLLRHVPLSETCEAFWSRRDELHGWLRTATQPGAAEDLMDVALFAAEVRLAADGAKQRPAVRCYLDRLDALGVLFGTNAVLETLRRRQLRALDLPVPDAPLPPAHSDWERFTLGRLYLLDGDQVQADRYLDAALAAQRWGFWPNYYGGIARYRAGAYAHALACFSVCIGADPTEPTVYYNRALVFAALGDRPNARADYDRALELEPHFAAAALNRALLHYEAGDWAKAERDLQHALVVGADAATAHYHLALVYHASCRDELARAHLEQVLAVQREHTAARALLPRLAPRP